MKVTTIKKLAAVGGAFTLAFSVLASPATIMPVQAAAAAEDNVAVPYSDIIEWRYKFEGNKIYRRLYNYGINQWVGEWIFVGYLS